MDKPIFTNRSLARLIGPLILEQLLAVTIGMADTIMVTGVGEHAVSAISLVDAINLLLIQVFSALATGGAVVAAQYLGARARERACDTAKQLVWSTTLIAALIGLVAAVWNGPILGAIYGALEPNVMENARVYFLISAISYPFLALYNAGAALYRSMGNSRISLIISLIMNVVNVAGNALLIFVFDMGVAGAALASLASRVLAAVIVTKLICHKSNPIHVNRLFHFEWNGDILRRILGIGVPNGMENGVFQVGKLVVSNLIAGLGTSVIAANAICNTVSGLVCVPGNAIGLALITVVGQCVGARAIREAQTNVKKLMFFTYGCMLVLNVFLFFLAAPVVALFDLSELATAISIDLLKQYAVFNSIFWPLSFPFANALRAAGDAKYTMWTSIGSMVLIRVGLSYLFILGPMDMGIYGVWNAMYVDWIVRITFFLPRYLKGKWKTMSAV